RIGQNLRSHGRIGSGRGIAPFWPCRSGGVRSEFHFALQDGSCSTRVHHQQNKIRCLSSKLESDAAAFQAHHRRSAPRSPEVISAPASHGAAAITAAQSERNLDDRRNHNYTFGLIEQILWNIVWNVENVAYDLSGILQPLLAFVVGCLRFGSESCVCAGERNHTENGNRFSHTDSS